MTATIETIRESINVHHAIIYLEQDERLAAHALLDELAADAKRFRASALMLTDIVAEVIAFEVVKPRPGYDYAYDMDQLRPYADAVIAKLEAAGYVI